MPLNFPVLVCEIKGVRMTLNDFLGPFQLSKRPAVVPALRKCIHNHPKSSEW